MLLDVSNGQHEWALVSELAFQMIGNPLEKADLLQKVKNIWENCMFDIYGDLGTIFKVDL